MGYSAWGSGDAQLKSNVNIDEIKEILAGKDIEFDFYNDGTEIEFWDNSTHWDEGYVMEFLNPLIPYITEGDMYYYGEDNCFWRYVLINGEWVEQRGEIYYTIEDMIKIIEEAGYKVSRHIV